VNGDPGIRCPLTEVGRAQAQKLAEELRDEPLDLVAITEFERVRETAEIALAGRDVPVLVVPELNDPRVGALEGTSLDEYRRWAWGRGPLDAPEGGEHRGELAGRFAVGYARLLERDEDTILLVAHSLTVRYALQGAEGRPPAARAKMVEYARPYRLDEAQVRRAVDVLRAWADAPVF
jgi:broad specificity phosphatase PhoE